MTGADKTTVTIPLPEDRAGALMELLEHFATRGVNICRIESRPTGSAMGDYFFSMDLEGHIHEPRVADALAGIHRVSCGCALPGLVPASRPKGPACSAGSLGGGLRRGDAVGGLADPAHLTAQSIKQRGHIHVMHDQ